MLVLALMRPLVLLLLLLLCWTELVKLSLHLCLKFQFVRSCLNYQTRRMVTPSDRMVLAGLDMFRCLVVNWVPIDSRLDRKNVNAA